MPTFTPSRTKCVRCDVLVNDTHLDRHIKGRECQLQTTIEEQKLQGWHACSRQLRDVLNDFGVHYRTKDYKDYGGPAKPVRSRREWLSGGQMPVLFVEGRVGVLAKGLKARPLRWVLERLTDKEFDDAVQSIMMMEGNLSAIQFAGSQWQNRKGVHKDKKIRAERAKA